MENEIEYEYNQFLSDMKNPAFLFGTYMDEDDYKYRYSHNSICEAIEILKEKIQGYLRKNRSGEFVLISRWHICVIKIEEAKRIIFSEKKIKDFTVW